MKKFNTANIEDVWHPCSAASRILNQSEGTVMRGLKQMFTKRRLRNGIYSSDSRPDMEIRLILIMDVSQKDVSLAQNVLEGTCSCTRLAYTIFPLKFHFKQLRRLMTSKTIGTGLWNEQLKVIILLTLRVYRQEGNKDFSIRKLLLTMETRLM